VGASPYRGNITYLWLFNPLLFPFPPFFLSFPSVCARGSRGPMSKQRKLNYLKLHVKSTNRKWFSPVAGDNIIRDCVFCPKNPTILCNFTKSTYRTIHTQKFLLHTLCVTKHGILGYKVNILQLLGDFIP